MREHCWSKPKAAVNIQFYAPIHIFLHAMSFLHFTKNASSKGRDPDFCSWKMLKKKKKGSDKTICVQFSPFLSEFSANSILSMPGFQAPSQVFPQFHYFKTGA